MQKSLDKAIMRQETANNPELLAGYWIGEKPQGKVYDAYLSNESWKSFKEDMQKNHPAAFSMYALGGGKEMEERKIGKFTYPPKMASFGSSSRMIFNLMKDNRDFSYEKKLPTTIGGTASLDGFIETKEKCVFVEAKCREPYGVKSNEISDKYQTLYAFLTQSANNNLTCHITPAETGKMEVRFFAGQEPLKNFDIKQMICHLLGIATAYLRGEYEKRIDFIYLLYNPAGLCIENTRHAAEILSIYNREYQECESVDFAGLFYDVLAFLQKREKIGENRNIGKIAEGFSFRICDQHTMCV